MLVNNHDNEFIYWKVIYKEASHVPQDANDGMHSLHRPTLISPKAFEREVRRITIDPIFTYIDNVIVHYSTLSFSTQSITVRPNQRDQTNQPTKAIID